MTDRTLTLQHLNDEINKISQEVPSAKDKHLQLVNIGQMITSRNKIFEDLHQTTCTTLGNELSQLENNLRSKMADVSECFQKWVTPKRRKCRNSYAYTIFSIG